MALDDRMSVAPRPDRWQAVFVERPNDSPQHLAAIFLRFGKGEATELYSGFPASKLDNRPLFSLWFCDAWAKAGREAHRRTVADAKAKAPPDPRW